MPSPTSSFSLLSLGTMPTTRAQALTSSQTEQPSAVGDDDDSEQFVVNWVEQQANPDGHDYIAVQITPAEQNSYAIRMGPQGTTHERPQCSCGDPPPCAHLSWLFRRIVERTVPEDDREETLEYWLSGATANAADPYQHAVSVGSGVLEAHLQHVYNDPEDISCQWQEIRETLAALSPIASDSYRPDIFDHPPSFSIEAALRSHDKDALMASILMTNERLFKQVRATLTVDDCARDFFTKKASEARSRIQTLDTYISSRVIPEGQDVTPDIPWCADQLTSIVKSIEHRVMNARTQLSSQTKSTAARALISILDAVANKNKDEYTAPNWGHQRQRLLPTEKRNLFYNLIGSWTLGSGRPKFIVEELVALEDVLPGFVSSIETIVDKLRENKTKERFIEPLALLIKRLKSADAPLAESSSSGAKRRAHGGSGSGSKRMKGA